MGWGNGQDGCMRLIASTNRCFVRSPVRRGAGDERAQYDSRGYFPKLHMRSATIFIIRSSEDYVSKLVNYLVSEIQ